MAGLPSHRAFIGGVWHGRETGHSGLLETTGEALPPEIETRLLAGVGQTKTYLGPTGHWGTGGKYNARWQVVVNVPEQQLLGEIRNA